MAQEQEGDRLVCCTVARAVEHARGLMLQSTVTILKLLIILYLTLIFVSEVDETVEHAPGGGSYGLTSYSFPKMESPLLVHPPLTCASVLLSPPSVHCDLCHLSSPAEAQAQGGMPIASQERQGGLSVPPPPTGYTTTDQVGC